MPFYEFVNTSSLYCSSYNPVNEDSKTLFHGEDFHIMLPSRSEVTFRNRSAPRSGDVFLMRDGKLVSSRARLNSQLSYLIIEAVGEEDEGVYTVKSLENPDDIRRTTLIVRGTAWHQCMIHYEW